MIFMHPALLIVDHMHFQYNGAKTGIALLAGLQLQKGRHLSAALLFTLLLNLKHIWIYATPVIFVFLLLNEGAVGRGCGGSSISGFLLRVARLGVVVLGSTAAIWAPVVLAMTIDSPNELDGSFFQRFNSSLKQMASRLFPFGRGLTHAYWAPNIWALYNITDRVAGKLGFGVSQDALPKHGTTSGLVEVACNQLLPDVQPPHCLLLVLCGYVTLFAVYLGSRKVGSSWKIPAIDFCFMLGFGSAVAFLAGWHVHEKAILMLTLPVAVHIQCTEANESVKLRRAFQLISCLSTLSVMPLIVPEATPFSHLLKWLLFASQLLLEPYALNLNDDRFRTELRLGVAVLAAPVMYMDLGLHELLFNGRWAFLPLMLTSVLHAAALLPMLLFVLRTQLEVWASERIVQRLQEKKEA